MNVLYAIVGVLPIAILIRNNFENEDGLYWLLSWIGIIIVAILYDISDSLKRK